MGEDKQSTGLEGVTWNTEVLSSPLAFLSPVTADGSAGDSGQRRLLICATGSHQQRHPASRRPITEGKSLQGHFLLNRFLKCLQFSFYSTY